MVRRLIASWHIPAGVARYYRWMILPDGGPRACPGETIGTSRQWPRIRASLDDGDPGAARPGHGGVGEPGLLRHNHQALAYGYARSGGEVLLRVYDPNSGPDDGVSIRFDPSAPARATAFTHNLNLGWPVRGFFLVPYTPAAPPPPPR